MTTFESTLDEQQMLPPDRLLTPVEHTPYVGAEFETKGLEGQRIAIIGWSCWFSEGEVDDDTATLTDIPKVIDGTYRIKFYTSIRNYFGYEDHVTFWPRVLFFNYLPSSVGGPDDRYGNGTPEQISRAKTRFLKIMRDVRLTKAFVFTSRHWAFPAAPEIPLGNRFPRFSRRTYVDPESDHAVSAYFLRHPQGANGEQMREAVRHALEEPIA